MNPKAKSRLRKKAPPSTATASLPLQMPKSLAAQTQVILRDRIQAGDWPQSLPSERELCNWLLIGRGTLRSALDCLAREGLLKRRQGRRWQVIASRLKQRQRQAPRNFVLLTSTPLNFLSPFETFCFDTLRAHLQDAGYQLEVRSDLACFAGKPNSALEELVARNRPAGWLLHSVSARVQHWFFDRELPSLVVGSRHEDVLLPSIDRDHEAACRHAAGLLVAKNRQRLVVVSADSGFAGDIDCEKSFRAAGEQALKGRDGEVVIVRHDSTPGDLQRRLGLLFRGPLRSTGMLVAGSKYTVGVLTYLLRNGLPVPGQVALISRDNDPYVNFAVPTVAHYAVEPNGFARKICRIVLRLAQNGALPPQVHRVVPTFVPGETLG